MKYIIVGAVAGGASTAARLRRLDEHAEIVIFEKGAYISYANCGLPYYIGNVIKDRNDLFVQTASSFRQRFNIDVRVQTIVTAIDRRAKTVTAHNLQSGDTYIEHYDKLVLSPGAEPVRPPLPGIELEGIFTLRNVADTDYIKSYVDQHTGNKAVIAGGGFIGLEMAENLHRRGMEVSVVEMGNQVLPPLDMPMAAFVQQHLRAKGVQLLLKTSVTGFSRKENKLQVMLNNGNSIDADVVLLSIGVRPDTKLAVEAGLETGNAKGIIVNEYLQTSDPNIYAVGDAIEYENPITGQAMNTYLAGPANKQGRICAGNIVHGNMYRYYGAVNTAIVQVFDMTAGCTGVNARQLAAAGIRHIVSTTHSGAHAGYYPGARQLTIQVQFAPRTGKLLGAQVVGYEGVDKRLDVLASLIKNNGTIYDLAEFEHAYAPPYSSAKDPLNMAGFVADNLLSQRLDIFYWNELEKIEHGDILLDVRTENEFNQGNIQGSINIPIDELRKRIDELPRNGKIFVYCEAGIRGYLGQRILKQSGFNHVKNLSGGYRLWKTCTQEIAKSN